MRSGLLSLSLISVLSVNAHAGERAVPDYGAYPLRWLEATSDLYPITQASREVQRETWMANKKIAEGSSTDEIRIEVAASDGDNASKQAQKIENYWVAHHHYPTSRILHEATLPSAWAGWVVVRSSTSRALPAVPPARLTAWLGRLPKALPQPVVAVAAPVAPLGPVDSIATSQAAALSPARFESESDLESLSGRRPPLPIRPYAALEFYSCEGWRTEKSDPKASASWLGPRLGFDAQVIHIPVAALGVSGSYYRSITPLSTDAQDSKAQEIEGSAWMLFRANTLHYGIPQIRLGGGYLQNRRWGTPASGGTFLPTFQGARFWSELSTEIDSHFTLGLHAAYTAAQQGLYEAGGQLTHNLFRLRDRQWDLTFGMNAAVARADTALGPRTQETWLSFQLGLSGGI